MSTLQEIDPECVSGCDAIETIIIPPSKDIGGFEVMRALPSKDRQMIGPFIFWDQMGPGEFLTNQGLDVRPHPHINLSTLTYLFDGEIMHRDSVGTEMVIEPGAVNLMTAGSGIVHSERTPTGLRNKTTNLFGIQSWLALPDGMEEIDPDFQHITKAELPFIEDTDFKARLVMGEAHGKTSPVKQYASSLYLDIQMNEGGRFPVPDHVEERGIYVLEGEIEIGGTQYESGRLLVLRPTDNIVIKALKPCRMLIMGGDAYSSPRHIWWNFVSSSKERIEQAKKDWREGKFPVVPTDKEEFIPLP